MVHQYQLNGYNIVLDTCSGSVHVVDDVAYDVIALYKERTAGCDRSGHARKVRRPPGRDRGRPAPVPGGCGVRWKQAGKLLSPDTYADMAVDFKNRNTVVKALCLHVAHTCNLNCSYCFA